MLILAVADLKMMGKFKLKNRKGFTLIELILYVALVGLFVTSAISFAWDLVYGRQKAVQQQIVDQNARSALARITYEIKRANSVSSINDFSLVLDNGGGSQTTIDLNASTLEITTDGAGPYSLTSNQVRVDTANPIFLNLGTSNNNTQIVGINLRILNQNPSSSRQFQAETYIAHSAEPMGQFNQARRLLVDLSAANFSLNSLTGLTIQNSAVSDVVIDKMNLEWSGTVGGESVTEIQIAAGAIEWSGNGLSGNTLDISDFTLTPSAGIVDVDYIDFDQDLTGGILTLAFVMADGSINKSNLPISSSGTPSPSSSPTPGVTISPTQTPTPTPAVSTCTAYCAANAYSSGYCDKNAGACSSSGNTNLPGGDQYCTGGPNADTCCCRP